MDEITKATVMNITLTDAKNNPKAEHLLNLQKYLNHLDRLENTPSNKNQQPLVVKDVLTFSIIDLLKKEPRLTYAEAYAALELAKMILKTESQFVNLNFQETANRKDTQT
ncbi:MAG: hypothetical protein LKF34_03595 [Acidaminococcaceae bacterium]|jgi:hypothetical protein|nr:hypothetical protein [Acidaminococcaceae bacterium]